MLIEFSEVQLSCDEEDDCTDGGEARIATGPAFGGLGEAIDAFDKAVGLSSVGPGDDPFEVGVDHLGHRFHRFDPGASEVDDSLLEHRASGRFHRRLGA